MLLVLRGKNMRKRASCVMENSCIHNRDKNTVIACLGNRESLLSLRLPSPQGCSKLKAKLKETWQVSDISGAHLQGFTSVYHVFYKAV